MDKRNPKNCPFCGSPVKTKRSPFVALGRKQYSCGNECCPVSNIWFIFLEWERRIDG